MMTSPGFFQKQLFLVLAVLCAIMPLRAEASGISEVVSTSPSWGTFTNRDGTGLYHEILREVFDLYGISVRHEYSKSNRAEELVEKGLADMKTCDTAAPHPLVMGRYPMYENSYYVFFRKDRIGPWRGKESLRRKEILSQPTYYEQADFPVPVTIKEVQTGAQALSMIVLDRSDFYVDDMTLIRQSIKDAAIAFSEDDFAIREVGRRSYHPLFNTTERGRKVRQLYEEGILRLHRSGKLREIFDKWDYIYPNYDRF